jgi:cell division septal protein FtsQ
MFGFFGQDSNKRRKKSRAKPANRKVAAERQPLDKKPVTPKLREQQREVRRRNGLKWVAGMGLGMSLIALGNTAVQETLFKNPRFSLRQVHVQTEGMLSPLEIIHHTGLVTGVNLLTVNLHDVRARLEQQPAIKGATVQRDFDGRLTVVVLQRQPVAWVKCEAQHYIPRSVGQGLLVDADGIAFPADTILPEFQSLPVISDEKLEPILLGQKISTPRFDAAMKLLKMLKQREAQGAGQLVSIATPNRFALLASFANKSEVTFSHDDVEAQMERYDHFLAEAKSKNWTFEKLNLVAGINTPVVFKTDPTAETPSAILVASPASVKKPAASNASKSSNRKSSRTSH